MKIKGLKKASGNTLNYRPYSGYYSELWLDRITGEVWAKPYMEENWWTEYHDKDVVKLANCHRHYTMAEIKELALRELARA